MPLLKAIAKRHFSRNGVSREVQPLCGVTEMIPVGPQ